MKVVIAGGGTAGHVSPSVAVADRLREADAEVAFIGSPEGPEATIVPAAGYPFHPVAASPLRRELSLRSAAAPLVALRSVWSSRPLVRDADVVLGMGGYASVPAVLAARSASVPIVLHEQNAIPGLANAALARIADAVALSFEETRRRLPARLRLEVTGTPVREQVLRVPERREAFSTDARSTLALRAGRITVLVTGGSLGARHLDETIASAIPLLAHRADLQLLVLTGRAHQEIVADAVPEGVDLVISTVPYLERIELALAIADLAVSRAGAATIHELTVCGVPAILVPYPHATAGHQEANARELERSGAAEVYLDAELTPEGLARRILALADDAERRRSMSERAAAWAKPDADRRVAALVEEVASR